MIHSFYKSPFIEASYILHWLSQLLAWGADIKVEVANFCAAMDTLIDQDAENSEVSTLGRKVTFEIIWSILTLPLALFQQAHIVHSYVVAFTTNHCQHTVALAGGGKGGGGVGGIWVDRVATQAPEEGQSGHLQSPGRLLILFATWSLIWWSAHIE